MAARCVPRLSAEGSTVHWGGPRQGCTFPGSGSVIPRTLGQQYTASRGARGVWGREPLHDLGVDPDVPLPPTSPYRDGVTTKVHSAARSRTQYLRKIPNTRLRGPAGGDGIINNLKAF